MAIDPTELPVQGETKTWGTPLNAYLIKLTSQSNSHDSAISAIPTGALGAGVASIQSGTSFTVPDPSLASTILVVMTANAQAVFPAVASGRAFTLVVRQDTTGNRKVTWPANLGWNNNTTPTLATAADRSDVFRFLCVDGVNWIGYPDAANVPSPVGTIVNDGGSSTGGSSSGGSSSGGAGGTGGSGTNLVTDTFDGANGSVPAAYTPSTTGSGSVAVQNNKLRLTTNASAYGAGANVLRTGGDPIVDSEMTVEFTVDSTSAEQYLSIGLRATAGAPTGSFPTNGYFLEISESTGTVQLRRAVNGTYASLTNDIPVTAGGLTPSATYKVRFRLDAARVRFRIWNVAATEPTAWLADYTDSSPYLTAGRIYLSAQNGNSSTARSFDVDNLVANSSVSSTATGVDVTIDDTGLKYTGTGWQTGTDAGTYGSGDHYTRTSGDAATYTATFVDGGTFAVVSKKAPHHGILSVSIDGGAATNADLYAATAAYQQTVYTSPALAAGSHTIKITASGTKNSAATDTVAEIDSLLLHNAVQGTTGTTTPSTSTGSGSTGNTGTASPTGFLTRSGNKVFLNGSPWRAAGTNLPWSFGCGAEVGLTPTIAQMQAMFAAARPNSIYRIWLFRGYSYTTFDNILNAARPYGHRFIPVLGDAQGGCGDSSGANNAAFYTGGWISNGWRDQHLTPTINRYKNEPLIGWWEWVNEPSPNQALRNFFDAVGAYVRNTLGDQHLIGTGTMSEYGNSSGMQLVNQSSYIDICSMHEYDETQYPSAWASKDAADAAAAGKPFYVGEFGIKPANDQAGGIAKKLAAYKAMPTCVAAVYWSTAAPGFQGASGRYEIATNSAAQNTINTFSFNDATGST